MSIEDALKERIPEMSADVHGGPSLKQAIQQGRARRRRRAVAAIGSGVATVCAVGVVAGGALTGVGPFADDAPNDHEREWVLAVPPEDVPYAIESAVREQLPDGAQITHTNLSAYGEGSKPLPKNRWEEATSWYGHFRLGPRETLSVGLTTGAAGDTEGNDRKYCEIDDQDAFYSCDYSELATGEHVMTEVMTARRANGPWYVGVNPDKVRPGKLWFHREVEIQPGGAYKIEITDQVKAETRAQADAIWTLDVDSMRRVVSRGEFLDNPGGG